MSVKVAMRVRPFNEREIQLNSQLCIEMKDNQTIIYHNQDGNKIPRYFSFDYSFWSHDSFSIQENGYFMPNNGSIYADQQLLFDQLGIQIINNAFQGYHTCLFAYGQTGSGKSYSMVGYGANKGIIPLVCEEIFKRIESNQNQNIFYEVYFSMMEIYNEHVQDLLLEIDQRPKHGLKIREHPKLGIYVEKLSKEPVNNYEEIENLMNVGNENRTIAATQMNANSSRAHTIIQIEFKQIENIGKKKVEKYSLINLVDLAGSEKQGKTGTDVKSDRFKEGCMINLSLSVLGKVISDLADKAIGKGKKFITPYRDSSLTRILQEALGGNSKTMMICAISPATDNYEESLSTLRYADQAKKIQCHAVINESEQDRMIRELRLENEELKRILQMIQIQNKNQKQPLLDNQDFLLQIKILEEKLEQNDLLMQEQQLSFQEQIQLRENKKSHFGLKSSKVGISYPSLINLNEDPQLTGKIMYPLTKACTTIGNKSGQPDIVLSALGINPIHAIIYHEKQDEKQLEPFLYIKPHDIECGSFLFVNGEKISKPRLLEQYDRLKFGTSRVYFLVLLKPIDSRKLSITDNDLIKQGFIGGYNWEFADQEFMKKSEILQKDDIDLIKEQLQIECIIQQKIYFYKYPQIADKQYKDMEQKFQQEKLQIQQNYLNEIQKLESLQVLERQSQKEKQLSEKKISLQQKMEAEQVKNQLEFEKEKKKLQTNEVEKVFINNQIEFYKQKLKMILPKILELNLISREMGKNVFFKAKLIYNFYNLKEMLTQNEDINISKQNKIKVEVLNQEVNQIYLWNLSKFDNRYDHIMEIYNDFHSENMNNSQQIIFKSKQEDPFWDPPEYHEIGSGYLLAQPLVYLLENQCDLLPLVNEKGKFGNLSVSIYPCDSDGNFISNDIIQKYNSPYDLLSQRFDFIISIDSAVLQEKSCIDTFIQYEIEDENGQIMIFRTNQCKGCLNINYDYIKQHTYQCLTKQNLNYLINSFIKFTMYGLEDHAYVMKYITEKIKKISQDYSFTTITYNNEKIKQIDKQLKKQENSINQQVAYDQNIKKKKKIQKQKQNKKCTIF